MTLIEKAYFIADGYNQYRDVIEGDEATVTIPKGTTSIVSYGFYYHRNLEALNVPDTLEEINYEGLASCSSLKSLILPHGFTTLRACALEGCSSLGTLYLPNTLSIVNASCISGCSSLKNVTFENGFNCNTSSNMNFGVSTQYTTDTLVGMFNALADRTGDTAYTLCIGSDNIVKLTAEQIAIATNKNWNLA